MLVRLTETAVRLLPPARGNSRAWPGEYLRHLPADPDWRFDLVSVYYDRSRVRPALNCSKMPSAYRRI
jgi:hypothetical protein